MNKQQYGKYVSVAKNKHATTEKLLEAMFSMWSAPKLHSKDHSLHKQYKILHVEMVKDRKFQTATFR
jgi:hypothetical protein